MNWEKLLKASWDELTLSEKMIRQDIFNRALEEHNKCANHELVEEEEHDRERELLKQQIP